MLKSRKTWFGILGVLALGIVAAFGLAAFTSRQSLAAPAPQATQAPNTSGQYQNFFLQALATRLGTTVEKLKAALVGAQNDTIDQAQKDGALTSDQATQLKNQANNWAQNGQGEIPGGELGFGRKGGRGFGGPGFGFGFGRGEKVDVLNAAATALGMDQQSLMTELQSGKSLAAVATEKNVDIAKVKQAILDAVKSQLDTAVKNNQLTQTQADNAYNKFSSNIDNLVNQTWMKGPHNWKNNPNNTNPTPNGTATPSGQGS